MYYIYEKNKNFFETHLRLSKYLTHIRVKNDRLDNYLKNNLNSIIFLLKISKFHFKKYFTYPDIYFYMQMIPNVFYLHTSFRDMKKYNILFKQNNN